MDNIAEEVSQILTELNNWMAYWDDVEDTYNDVPNEAFYDCFQCCRRLRNALKKLDK